MNIHQHAELALINVEYAAADCDQILASGTDLPAISTRLSLVSGRLAAARQSLQYVVDELNLLRHRRQPIRRSEARGLQVADAD